MSSDASDAKRESKPTSVSAKWIRCKDCVFGQEINAQQVMCSKYGAMYKTNSCIYKQAR